MSAFRCAGGCGRIREFGQSKTCDECRSDVEARVAAPTLFDAPVASLPVRSTDPETSRAAARQLDVRQRQAEVLAALRLLTVSSTAAEIQACLRRGGINREKNEVASRLAELADAERFGEPLVRKVGVKEGNRGRKCATWALTAAGASKARESV